MKIQQEYTIKKVQKDNCHQVIEFIMRIRGEIFPMLSQSELPADLLDFEQHYIHEENAVLYAAFSQDEEVLGTIGVCPYDGRFIHLKNYYHQFKTAEIVKCYIDSDNRRSGIGSMLFNKALKFCNDVGYQKLYLHTHPFLPGAISFWEANGFEVKLVEEDSVWNTIHMDRSI